MSFSTPIDQLRRSGHQQMQQNDNQFVEDILKEINQTPNMEQQANINSNSFQYATDSSQVPPNQYIPPSTHHNSQNTELFNNQLTSLPSSNNILNNLGINLNTDNLKDKCLKNIKLPLLVFILSFIISLPEFNRFLFSFFPNLLLESGQITIYGVILKSIISMLLFFIISIFIN